MQDLKPNELAKILLQSAGDYDVRNLRKIVELNKLPPDLANPRNNGGNTPCLMAAQINKEREVITVYSYLIQIPGTDFNAVNKQGTTALMIGAKKGHSEAVDYLLGVGVDFELIDENKKSALDYASNPAIKASIQNAINLKAAAARLKSVQEYSVMLHGLIQTMLSDPAMESFRLQRMLGNKPFPEGVDYPNESNLAPLQIAVDNNRTDIVQMLIDQGADPSCVDSLGKTLLMRLCSAKRLPSYPNSKPSRKKEEDRLSMVRIIIGSINYKHLMNCDKNGWSVLHWASFMGYDEDCRLIISRCQEFLELFPELLLADDNISVVSNGSVGSQASRKKTGMRREDSSASAVSATKSKPKRLSSIESSHADSGSDAGSATSQSRGGKRKTGNAEGKGSGETAKVKKKANPPIKCAIKDIVNFREVSYEPYRGTPKQRWRRGDTAMLLAIRRKYLHVVKVLVELGRADVNASGTDLMTPLMWACWNGDTESVRYLLVNGAMPNLQSEYGKTALHWSIERGFSSIATMLLHFDHGDDPDSFAIWPPPPDPEVADIALIEPVAVAPAVSTVPDDDEMSGVSLTGPEDDDDDDNPPPRGKSSAKSGGFRRSASEGPRTKSSANSKTKATFSRGVSEGPSGKGSKSGKMSRQSSNASDDDVARNDEKSSTPTKSRKSVKLASLKGSSVSDLSDEDGMQSDASKGSGNRKDSGKSASGKKSTKSSADSQKSAGASSSSKFGRSASSRSRRATELAALKEAAEVDEDELASKLAAEALAASLHEQEEAARLLELERLASAPPPVRETWCNPNLALDNMSTPVLTLCRLCNDQKTITEDDAVDLLYLLVKRGASVNIMNTDGITPFMWATMNGAHKLMKELLALGADPFTKDRDRRDALTMIRHKDFTAKIIIMEGQDAWNERLLEEDNSYEEEVLESYS